MTRTRTPRSDGKATRQHILEQAAILFAEKGYAYTTSREICHCSGTNAAAINYHFDGKQGLYEAVLMEMHDRLIQLNTLEKIHRSAATPEQKLCAVIDELMKSIIERRWHARMFLRELLSPTPALRSLLTQKILPKLWIVKNIISEITAIPPDHPMMTHALINLIAPNAALLTANEQLLHVLLPGLRQEHTTVAGHIKQYALGGLHALAQQYRQEQATVYTA